MAYGRETREYNTCSCMAMATEGKRTERAGECVTYTTFLVQPGHAPIARLQRTPQEQQPEHVLACVFAFYILYFNNGNESQHKQSQCPCYSGNKASTIACINPGFQYRSCNSDNLSR